MSRKNYLIWTILTLAFFMLPFKPAAAQESYFIEAIYPQQGSPGEVIDMLVRGGGFESVRELNAVILNDQEIPILDWVVLSDDVVKVQLMIPEESPIRDTEIRFIFDDIPMDAFFSVTERGDGPFIEEFFPQEGQIDTEVPISFTVRNYFLGEFGGITIGNEEIPVNSLSVNDSGEAWEFLAYLPTYLEPGDSVINLYFQTYTFSSYFLVHDANTDEPLSPAVYGYDPNEAQMDTDIEFTLEGYVLPELGSLQAILIGDIELPIYYYELNSDEIAVAGSYLPPDIPPGENRITFYFENYRYTDTFFVAAPETPVAAPRLFSLRPQEASPDSDDTLLLQGENLENLGELNSVRIGQFYLEDIYYDIESPGEAVVYVYFPENTPQGEQTITVSFENAEIRETFLITETVNHSPWGVLIAVIAGIGAFGVVIGGGYAVARAIRKGKTSKEESRDDTKKRPIHADYKVNMDLGVQTIEPTGSSLIKDLDIHLEVTGDPGEQTIEPDGNSLVDES